MITILTHTAAFVLPSFALLAAGMAAVVASAKRPQTVTVADRAWTPVYGTSSDPQSRGTTG